MASVRELQERAARALPAEHVEHVGDWWLRRSASTSWWLSTVLPHGPANTANNTAENAELAHMISVAERFYAGSGTATTFQVCPGACPADLDATLAGRGYRRGGTMSLRTAATAQVRALGHRDGPRITLSDSVTSAWFDAWYAVSGHGGDPRVERDILDRVTLPSGFACALAGDQVIAVGRAVADDGVAGVFGMATLPRARGRGAAGAVLAGLAEWAAGQRADQMYLQVETDNDAALLLYDRAGFTEVCRYHYRTKPQASVPPGGAGAVSETRA